MFLVTFAGSPRKITLKITLSLSFLFYVEGIKEFNSDAFRITDHKINYLMKWLCYALPERFQITLNIMQI